MKILMVTSNISGGGVGHVVYNLYHSLKKQNIRCDVTSYGEEKKDLLIEIENNGDKIWHINNIKNGGPYKYAKKLYNICKQEKYDVVHIHISLMSWIPALAAKLAGVPVCVAHGHGEKFLNYPKWVLLFIEPLGRFLNRFFCNQLVACSKRSGEYNFGKKAKVTILANYIPKEDLLSIPEKDIQEEKNKLNSKKYPIILGYMGSLDGVKNTIFLPDVIYELKRIGIEALLLIAGNGEMFGKLEDKIKNLKLENNVKLLGYRNDCNKLVQVFDYYISSSISEGMSLSMIEAQMCGKPCFASSLISKESDLGIGLFKQISGFEAKRWANEIKKYIDDEGAPTPREEVIQKLDKTKKSEKYVVKQLIKIYSGENNENS